MSIVLYVAKTGAVRLRTGDRKLAPGSAAPFDPARLTHRHYLTNGVTIRLRAIEAGDRIALREQLFLKLGKESLRNRFFGFKADLSESELTNFCRVDFCRHVAVVAEVLSSGSRRLVGVGRMVRASSGAVAAEIAITVQDEFQGLGIGGMLLRKLVDAARELGIERLVGSMFAQNYRMAKLVRASGLPCETSLDNGILTLSIDLRAGRASNLTGDTGDDISPKTPIDPERR